MNRVSVNYNDYDKVPVPDPENRTNSYRCTGCAFNGDSLNCMKAPPCCSFDTVNHTFVPGSFVIFVKKESTT